jgi:hypothetical protein
MTEGHVVLFSRMTEGQSCPGVKLLQRIDRDGKQQA